MGIFEIVKANVGMRTAAEYYGLNVRRNGFTCCPFHNDKHPSMKLYKEHYHCFTCGAHGDVISLTAQILGLSQYEAAQRLAADFEIDTKAACKPKRKNYISVKEARELLTEYISLLESVRDKYCPATPDEEWHPLFCDSVRWLPLYKYYLELLDYGNYEEQKQFIKEQRRMLNALRIKLNRARMAV